VLSGCEIEASIVQVAIADAEGQVQHLTPAGRPVDGGEWQVGGGDGRRQLADHGRTGACVRFPGRRPLLQLADRAWRSGHHATCTSVPAP